MTDDTTLTTDIWNTENITCPVCDHPFGEPPNGGEDWDDLGGYHYPRSGGKNTYGCPEDGCDGVVEVYM